MQGTTNFEAKLVSCKMAKNLNVSWPWWLPAPIACFKAAILTLWLAVVGELLHLPSFRRMLAAATVQDVQTLIVANHIEHGLMLLLYAYAHHWLMFGRQESKSAMVLSANSLWIGFYSWAISITAILLTTFILESFRQSYGQILGNHTDELSGIICFCLLAYGYHLEHVIRKTS